jgi:general secretion pathway protein M
MALSTAQLRDKWERITPRERRLVVALGSTFVVVILLWVGFTISDGLAAIEAKNKTTREALRSLQVHRAEVAQGASSDVPTIPKEAVRLQTYLEGIAKDVGVNIPGYTPRTPVTRGDYTEVSTSIEMRGLSIYELKDFLEAVEKRSNVVAITDLRVKQHFREPEKLDVEMIITTYKQAAAGGDQEEG